MGVLCDVCIYERERGDMSGRMYTSTSWTGKKTEAEVFERVREAFRGLSARIDNVRVEHGMVRKGDPEAAAKWRDDGQALVTWRNKAKKHVGEDSLMTAFDWSAMLTLTDEGVGLVRLFLEANSGAVSVKTSQTWKQVMALFVRAFGEYRKVRTLIDMKKAFTSFEGQVGNAAPELKDWMDRMRVASGCGSTDQVQLDAMRALINSKPTPIALMTLGRTSLSKEHKTRLRNDMVTYLRVVQNFIRYQENREAPLAVGQIQLNGVSNGKLDFHPHILETMRGLLAEL